MVPLLGIITTVTAAVVLAIALENDFIAEESKARRSPAARVRS